MIKRILSVLMILLLAFGTAAPAVIASPIEASAAGTGDWIGAWGTGMTEYQKGISVATESSIRVVVAPNVGGSKIRFKLSNKFGTQDIEIKRMTVAKSAGGSDLVVSTLKQLRFEGKSSNIVIPAGQEIYTDEVDLQVKANEELAVTFYFEMGDSIFAAQKISTIGLSGGRSYKKSGDYTRESSMTDNWGPIKNEPDKLTYGKLGAVPIISDLDVYTDAEDPYSVVVIGDSTVANKFPDMLSRAIQFEGKDGVGVVGKGIIGNSLMINGSGESGSIYGRQVRERLLWDVLNLTNVRYVILKVGMSDIIHPKSTASAGYGSSRQPYASEMIDAFKAFIIRCHDADIRVIACSITPWKGTTRNYFGMADEPKYTWNATDWQIAEEVNAWLASTDMLDGFVDLNAISADSRDAQKLKDDWTEDYMNPNETAQQAWAEEIPLHYFGIAHAPAKLKLSKDSISLTKGGSFNLIHTITPATASNADVEWSSSNSAVASVNSSGKVTAKGNGTAIITCETYNGKKATCKVTVTTLTNGLELSETSLKMYTTQKKTIKATVKPSSASNKKLTWSSSDTAVATVSSSGTVTAKGKGTATITCRTQDGGAVAICKVTVTKKKSVKGIKLNKSSKTVYKGKTYQLTATITPSNASNKKINWKSSNSSVATVSSSGKVTAKKNGTANIMATTADGNLVATCKIKVKTKTKGVSIKENATAYIGKTLKLKATIKPSSASNKDVTWSSSNKSVATVNSKGVVKGKKAGTVTITVTTKDGNFKDTCKVKVTKYVKAKDVELNSSSKKLIVGESYRLKATVSPSNASNKNVTWKSSDKSVAKVSSSGKITAVGKGTATITCTTKDGKIKDKCKVTVKTVKVKSLKISESSLKLMIGDSEKLIATIKPTNASNKNVTWKSSNTSIARVNSKGNVTGVSRGTATITCTTKDGKIKKTCKVTVYGVPTDDDQKVMGIRLNKNELTLKAGKSQTLVATVLPQNAANQMVTWSSSNSSVVSVSKNGKITALKPGKAIISVKTSDGGWKASCVVTVN